MKEGKNRGKMRIFSPLLCEKCDIFVRLEIKKFLYYNKHISIHQEFIFSGSTVNSTTNIMPKWLVKWFRKVLYFKTTKTCVDMEVEIDAQIKAQPGVDMNDVRKNNLCKKRFTKFM